MKKVVFFCLFTFVPLLFLYGQSVNEKELDKIAASLANQLNRKAVNRIAVVDFAYMGEYGTAIGNSIANQISTLLVKKSVNYTVMSRAKVQELLMSEEAPKRTKAISWDNVTRAASSTLGQGKDYETQTKIRAAGEVTGAILNGIPGSRPSIQTVGKKLKGADVIIFGTIDNAGDNLSISLEATRNDKNGDNIAVEEGTIVKTPDIMELIQQQPAMGSSQPIAQGQPRTTPAPSFSVSAKEKRQNLSFEVVSAMQNGSDVEIRVNIVSIDKDDEYSVNVEASRFFNADDGSEFHLAEVNLVDKSGTHGWVQKTLTQNTTIPTLLRFTNVNKRIASISKLEIRSWSQINGHFSTSLTNIPVQ